MSRLADTVEAPSEDLNAAPATPIYAPDDKTRTVAHDQQSLVSITSEALPIDHPSSIIELHMPDLLSIQKGKFNEEQECDKERGTMAETIDMNITSRSADENPRIGDALGIENERLTGQSEGIKAGVSLAGLVAQPAQLVKEETSPSLTPIREAPSPVSNSAMPSRGTFSKKAAPGGPRRPGTKKRKLESRADTPQSQRSGTPNSMLGGRSASRAKKQNSATPLYSSPAPDDNEDDDDESDDGLYCICRKGDDHTWMIACDGGCDDWFHGRCIGIDQRDGRLIDKFICPNCSESRGAETTWKPMCRLDGCREPAAVNALRPSKYCCDDHAAQFFRRFIKKGLGTDTPASAKKRRRDNLTDNFQNREDDYDRPAHLRGGLLSPAELKTVTNGLQSCGDFRSLGENVPVINEEERNEDAMDIDTERKRYTAHESEQLEKTMSRTQKLRHQLRSLEDRERFLALVKGRAKSVSEELKKKDKSMKDMCGFDGRLRWSDEYFDIWCNSEEGGEALKLNKLGPDLVDTDGDANMADANEPGKGICMRKRCKQHDGWSRLHSLDFTYSKSDISREISQLVSEEQGIRERAVIRYLEAKAESNGSNGYF